MSVVFHQAHVPLAATQRNDQGEMFVSNFEQQALLDYYGGYIRFGAVPELQNKVFAAGAGLAR